jgi:hypothetical protein
MYTYDRHFREREIERARDCVDANVVVPLAVVVVLGTSSSPVWYLL